jgi:hypothetical protein
MPVVALLLVALLLVAVLALPAQAEEPAPAVVMDLGPVKLTSPEGWVAKKPRVNIIRYEFAAPAAKEDTVDGRMTVMAAGGSIDANLERWYGQFTQPDGKPTSSRAQVEKKQINGFDVHLVELRGTYEDKPGPFAPGVKREDYLMLAAIIVTDQGNLYLKFYGPRETISSHSKAFDKMVESLAKK